MDKYVTHVYNKLRKLIPNAKSELKYNTPFELLVAVILSAQCTDKRVNQVTEHLFKVANTPEQFASMGIGELEPLIHSCGFYHNKAKNIINCSKQIVEQYGGQVPDNYDDLVSLSGVGSKTANVMLAVGFGKPGLAVDTHVYRVSNRLGLSNAPTPIAVERQLKQLFDTDKWSEVHHLLLLFGRYYCTSRSPKCEGCYFRDKCTYFNKKGNK